MATALLCAVIIWLAAARITRIITTDKIAEPFRLFVATHLRQPEFNDAGTIQIREGSKITYLIFCRWCTGLWVSIPAACLTWWPAHLGDHLDLTAWIAVPALALAYSHLIGLAVRIEAD